MGVEAARKFAGRRRAGRHFERRRAEIEARRGSGGGAQGELGKCFAWLGGRFEHGALRGACAGGWPARRHQAGRIGRLVLIIWLNSEYGSARRAARGSTGRGENAGAGRAFHQPLANGVAHEIVHERCRAGSGPRFRRMHVDVHLFGIAFEKQQRERKGGGRHQVVIRRGNRVQQQAVANQAAVHENERSNCDCPSAPAGARRSRSGGTAGGRLVRLRGGIRRWLRGRHARRRQNRSRSRVPISTSSSSTWLPKTW
jgi:hypothetical protein